MNSPAHTVAIKRTDSTDTGFIELVNQLNRYLQTCYGKQQEFYDQFNKLDSIKNVVVAYNNELPVGCGAFKEFDAASVEIKRMFVLPEQRGSGVAKTILYELEQWAKELHYQTGVLELGDNQPEALKLYESCGYGRTANYGQYIGVETSICMKKSLL